MEKRKKEGRKEGWRGREGGRVLADLESLEVGRPRCKVRYGMVYIYTYAPW